MTGGGFPDIPVVLARQYLSRSDDAQVLAGFDTLEARYGWETASRAWSQACAEMDAEAEREGA